MPNQLLTRPLSSKTSPDTLVLTKTWLASDAPNCITKSLAPDSFITMYQHCDPSSSIAVIFCQNLRPTKIEFCWVLNLKFNAHKSSFIISSTYCPPNVSRRPISSRHLHRNQGSSEATLKAPYKWNIIIIP